MARLPSKEQLSGPVSLRSGRTVAQQNTTAIGRGIQSLGASIEGISNDLRQQQNAVDLARAESFKTEQFLAVQNDFDSDPDYVTFERRAPGRTKDVIDKAANLIRDPQMRERWLASAQGDAARVNDGIRDRGFTLARQAETVAGDEALEINRRIYADPDTPEDVREKAYADISASIDMGEASGLYTPAEAAQRREVFEQGGDFSRATLYAERTGHVPGDEDAAALLRRFEGFRDTPYWDVNADRVGYGSDTVTRADGTVERVTKDTRVSREDAERDLSRRIGEFQRGIQRDVGAAEWGALPSNAKAALTSVAYNYGSLPKSVVEAVKSGNMSAVADAVEGLSGHNDGINAKRRREEAAVIRGDARPEWFRRLSPEQKQFIQDKAGVVRRQNDTAEAARLKAEYEAYKDKLGLDILTHRIPSETIILQDPLLNDGDKATLLRSFRSEMGNQMAIADAVSEFAAGNLRVDPYDSDGKKTVDGVYDAVVAASPENAQAITDELVRQTGSVPKSVVNSIRKGLTSTDVATVEQAAQAAHRISQINPAALSRRDGGSDAQRMADDFSFYVNNLNMTPEDAAQRLRDAQDPQRQRDRKALEPAAKEFMKQIENVDLGSMFDESWIPFNDPAIGFNEGQRLGITAEYQAIAEQEFYATNGNAELAMNRAQETMKRLYGVTELSGSKVVMKHPPERYWPAMPGSDPFGYAREQIVEELSQFISDDDVTGWFPTTGAREAALPDMKKQMLMNSLIIQATPDTDAMVKAGQLPAYFVGYVDPNGNVQTIPGKLFQPDISAVRDETMRRTAQEADWAREDDAEIRSRQDSPDGGRDAALDRYLDGPTLLPRIEVPSEGVE